jgi:hypothetical protein
MAQMAQTDLKHDGEGGETMAQDRYVKSVLTVIAVALVYLSVVLTPWPRVAAQAQTQPPLVRPGDPTGPMPVVVVGWRTGDVVPVAVGNAVTATVQNTVQVSGSVTTERSAGAADRSTLRRRGPGCPRQRSRGSWPRAGRSVCM